MEEVQGRREKNPGSKWTEDRKKRHSEMWSLDGRKKNNNNNMSVSYTHLTIFLPNFDLIGGTFYDYVMK